MFIYLSLSVSPSPSNPLSPFLILLDHCCRKPFHSTACCPSWRLQYDNLLPTRACWSPRNHSSQLWPRWQANNALRWSQMSFPPLSLPSLPLHPSRNHISFLILPLPNLKPNKNPRSQMWTTFLLLPNWCSSSLHTSFLWSPSLPLCSPSLLLCSPSFLFSARSVSSSSLCYTTSSSPLPPFSLLCPLPSFSFLCPLSSSLFFCPALPSFSFRLSPIPFSSSLCFGYDDLHELRKGVPLLLQILRVLRNQVPCILHPLWQYHSRQRKILCFLRKCCFSLINTSSPLDNR